MINMSCLFSLYSMYRFLGITYRYIHPSCIYIIFKLEVKYDLHIIPRSRFENDRRITRRNQSMIQDVYETKCILSKKQLSSVNEIAIYNSHHLFRFL